MPTQSTNTCVTRDAHQYLRRSFRAFLLKTAPQVLPYFAIPIAGLKAKKLNGRSMMIMVEAMKAANSTDPKVFAAKLRATNYNGLTGKVAFDDKGDIKNGTLTLYTYKGGKQDKIGVVR
jgi:hypothetical protein